jgi:cytochrome c biogenesis protein CcdA
LILIVLAYIGGIFTIVSPCILPVLPFVFTNAYRSFVRSGLPLPGGMALTFAATALPSSVSYKLKDSGGQKDLRPNEIPSLPAPN